MQKHYKKSVAISCTNNGEKKTPLVPQETSTVMGISLNYQLTYTLQIKFKTKDTQRLCQVLLVAHFAHAQTRSHSIHQIGTFCMNASPNVLHCILSLLSTIGNGSNWSGRAHDFNIICTILSPAQQFAPKQHQPCKPGQAEHETIIETADQNQLELQIFLMTFEPTNLVLDN